MAILLVIPYVKIISGFNDMDITSIKVLSPAEIKAAEKAAKAAEKAAKAAAKAAEKAARTKSNKKTGENNF